ncbi:unnamed protein product [Orchesella dallaii]|uniref:Uncharacterized protein n=1 Tax=Orchesella dallaii TaxID=48710 RepID=A0ABP1QI00_9HEXA
MKTLVVNVNTIHVHFTVKQQQFYRVVWRKKTQSCLKTLLPQGRRSRWELICIENRSEKTRGLQIADRRKVYKVLVAYTPFAPFPTMPILLLQNMPPFSRGTWRKVCQKILFIRSSLQIVSTFFM